MGRFTMTYLGFASGSASRWLSSCAGLAAQLHTATTSCSRCLPQLQPTRIAGAGLGKSGAQAPTLRESAFSVSFLEAHDIQTTYSVIRAFLAAAIPFVQVIFAQIFVRSRI